MCGTRRGQRCQFNYALPRATPHRGPRLCVAEELKRERGFASALDPANCLAYQHPPSDRTGPWMVTIALWVRLTGSGWHYWRLRIARSIDRLSSRALMCADARVDIQPTTAVFHLVLSLCFGYSTYIQTVDAARDPTCWIQPTSPPVDRQSWRAFA
jgi:hypothetical protein